MDNVQGAPDARAVIRDHLRQGVRVTPLCRAVMGWLSGATTDPAVDQIRLSGDGGVWLRLSDEAEGAVVCSFLNFLDQVRVIGETLGLEKAEVAQLVGWARARLF